jgi:hypothetical protein
MGEFLRLKPPTFAGSSNPLDVDDWLCTIKRKLEASECPEISVFNWLLINFLGWP